MTTRYEVLWHVRDQLLRQAEKCQNDTGTMCLYRDEKGRACAAGHTFPDSVYNPEMEGKSFWELVSTGMLPSTDNDNVIVAMQSIHDKFDPEHWDVLFHFLESILMLLKGSIIHDETST